MNRRLKPLFALAAAAALASSPALTQGTLRVDMTASDIPLTTGFIQAQNWFQDFSAITMK